MNQFHKEQKWLAHYGVNISYQYYSSSPAPKPAIVFVHGLFSSKFCYRFMIPELLEHFDIFTFDYPPFGDSDKSCTYHFTYQNFANIIVELLDKHNIPKATIAGHSMGGQIALLCAHLFPERVENLILFAPSTYIKKANKIMHTVTMLPFFPFLLKRFLYKKGAYEALIECVYDPQMINKEMIQEYMRPFLKEEMFQCLSKMIRDREGDLTSEYLQKINSECLVFWGKEDRVLPVSLGYQLVQDLPAASLETFEKIGHLLPEEIPFILTDKIKQFCTSQKRATS
ncbi:alpha/beta fold hydrolase [Pontibacillus yanchengensis]|uniref:Alpha/beta fold hydrolase n=2 Tax=Pontibacillus yanchengensis TaxID=462910 RepID=A0ACC7VMB2_9BACI|nr:alpha/beta fold hydrolase [Pontibacillus yanchengensis]MYL55329.1 alpha/beta fold hydrolase [Pontibacillus yanchengensis]